MTSLAMIDHVLAGGLSLLKPEGQRTGLFKKCHNGLVRVELNGLVGDQHGDPRVHGGPEKAVHQYAAENYPVLGEAFPHCAGQLLPGSLGENLSGRGLTERNVHIGDLYRIGTAVLQVSQPRNPCWKINHRFDTEQMSMFIARQRITGWYYRVIKPGIIQAGDYIELLERHNERFSIDGFWQVQQAHRPVMDDLLALAAAYGLAEDWRRRLTERAKWLRKHLSESV